MEPKDNIVDRETKRAEEMQKQRAAKEQRQRNSLPPFLLVRSGFWGSCVFPMVAGAMTYATPYQDGQNPRFYLWFGLTGMLTLLAGLRTSSQLKKVKEDIKSIQYEMSEYVKDPEYVLDLSRNRNFPNTTSILVRHITKNNPGVFDRFIANPKSIADNEAMQDIIIAYLKKHADAAPRILEALKQIQTQTEVLQYVPGEDRPQPTGEYKAVLPVSYELRKRLERCARRTKMTEICH